MFKELLKDLDIPKKHLASILNISPRLIEFWETSNTMPDKKVLQKIEKIFNVDVNKYKKEPVEIKSNGGSTPSPAAPTNVKLPGRKRSAARSNAAGNRRIDIYKLRKDNGLTQQDFADKVGVSRNTVSQWETWKKSPTYKYLKRMEDLFHVNLSNLKELKKAEEMELETPKDFLEDNFDMDSDMSIRRNFSVRMLRQQLRMSQKHFAQRIGVSQQLVSKWETAEVKINQRNLRLIAEAFPEETKHLPFLSKQMPDIDIGQLCKQYNLTQGELARKLGVSKQIVSQWILGRTKPGPKNMEKIVRLFNIESPLNNIPPDLGIKVVPKGPDDIRGIRLAYNLSQKEFAKRIGFSSQTVSNWETGRLKPGKKARRKITSIFPIDGIEHREGQRFMASESLSGIPSIMESWVQGRKEVFVKMFENKALILEDIYALPNNQLTLVCEKGTFVFTIQLTDDKLRKLKEIL